MSSQLNEKRKERERERKREKKKKFRRRILDMASRAIKSDLKLLKGKILGMEL